MSLSDSQDKGAGFSKKFPDADDVQTVVRYRKGQFLTLTKEIIINFCQRRLGVAVCINFDDQIDLIICFDGNGEYFTRITPEIIIQLSITA